MAKVKIQTARPGNFGRTVSFGDVQLTFDRLGFAEVESKEIAEKLEKKFAGWLFIGEAPKPEIKPDNAEEVKELNQQIALLRDENTKVKATLKVVEEQNTEWKNQLEKYREAAEQAVNELEEYKGVTKKQIADLELKAKLAGKTVAELREMCATLEIPEERYKGKNKEETIKIILDESRQK